MENENFDKFEDREAFLNLLKENNRYLDKQLEKSRLILEKSEENSCRHPVIEKFISIGMLVLIVLICWLILVLDIAITVKLI